MFSPNSKFSSNFSSSLVDFSKLFSYFFSRFSSICDQDCVTQLVPEIERNLFITEVIMEARFEFVNVKSEIDEQQLALEDDNELNVTNEISGANTTSPSSLDADESVKTEGLLTDNQLVDSVILHNTDNLSTVKTEDTIEVLEHGCQVILNQSLYSSATSSKDHSFSKSAVLPSENEGRKNKNNGNGHALHKSRFVNIMLDFAQEHISVCFML